MKYERCTQFRTFQADEYTVTMTKLEGIVFKLPVFLPSQVMNSSFAAAWVTGIPFLRRLRRCILAASSAAHCTFLSLSELVFDLGAIL